MHQQYEYPFLSWRETPGRNLAQGILLQIDDVLALEPFRERITGRFRADVQGTTIPSALKRNHGTPVVIRR